MELTTKCIYVDAKLGSDDFSGLSETIINGDGPLKSIQSAVNRITDISECNHISVMGYDDIYYDPFIAKSDIRIHRNTSSNLYPIINGYNKSRCADLGYDTECVELKFINGYSDYGSGTLRGVLYGCIIYDCGKSYIVDKDYFSGVYNRYILTENDEYIHVKNSDGIYYRLESESIISLIDPNSSKNPNNLTHSKLGTRDFVNIRRLQFDGYECYIKFNKDIYENEVIVIDVGNNILKLLLLDSGYYVNDEFINGNRCNESSEFDINGNYIIDDNKLYKLDECYRGEIVSYYSICLGGGGCAKSKLMRDPLISSNRNRVTNCISINGGGLYYCSIVEDSIISDCESLSKGGGLYCSTVTGSDIRSCISSRGGAAFSTTLTNCNLSLNKSYVGSSLDTCRIFDSELILMESINYINTGVSNEITNSKLYRCNLHNYEKGDIINTDMFDCNLIEPKY